MAEMAAIFGEVCDISAIVLQLSRRHQTSRANMLAGRP
jgi:hypothetical protein